MKSFFVDLPFPVDQISCHINQIKNAIDRTIPIFE